MASELRVNTLKDASGNNSVATSTVAQGSAKFWITYDAVADNVDGSFNHSSLTDVDTGEHAFSFTNNFGSATNKAAFASVFNSVNGTSKDAGGDRAGAAACIGGMETFRALSASEIYVSTAYQARSASDGDSQDYKAVYCTVFGDYA